MNRRYSADIHKLKANEPKPYLITNFTLVKNSVQITSISNLITIHRCYDVA